MRRTSLFLAVLLALVCSRAITHGQAPAPQLTGPRGLDFQTFRTQIQPIFLKQRADHARCYACHHQATNFRLQELSPGATTWNEEQSRLNFLQMQRVVVPGQPKLSRFLLMPLDHEAGGTEFHPGGKHFASMEDPEVKTIVTWISTVRQ